MLDKTEKKFSLIFTIIVAAELLCITIEGLSNLRYITKPSIIISLLCFFIVKANSIDAYTKKASIFALALSLIGDVLLMFVDRSPHFFTLGLVAFLLAHVFYILVFLQKRNTKEFPKIIFAGLLLIAVSLFLLLKDHLDNMLIPVFIYMLVILSMVNSSFLRKGKVPKWSYQLVVFGAILFLISDSILAINKFYQPFPLADILIMSTYALAQFFIVLGIKKQS